MRDPVMHWATAVLATALGGAATSGEVIRLEIRDLAYTPEHITVRLGEAVQWTNRDFVDHTITTRDGRVDLTVGADRSVTYRPDAVGDIAYICRFHPNMTGVLHVVAK